MTSDPEIRSGDRWFKGNLHAHSFWSDGHGFPEMIAEWFKSHGYHFLSLTEHDQLQIGEKWTSLQPGDAGLLDEYAAKFGKQWVQLRSRAGAEEIRLKRAEEYGPLVEQPDRFILLSGEEVTARYEGLTPNSASYVNVFNLPEPIPPPPPSRCGGEAIGAVVAAGETMRNSSGRTILVSLNHPNWKWNATAADILAADGLRFMEIHTALNSCFNEGDTDHPPVSQIWDEVLAGRCRRKQPLVYGLASDDCHAYVPGHYSQGDRSLPGRAWVMVRADDLSPESLMRSVARGDFYCSTGLSLDELASGAGHINVRVAPHQGARRIIRFIGTRQNGGASEVLAEHHDNSASYSFRGDELYVRAEIISDRPVANPSYIGQTEMAWTEPITL